MWVHIRPACLALTLLWGCGDVGDGVPKHGRDASADHADTDTSPHDAAAADHTRDDLTGSTAADGAMPSPGEDAGADAAPPAVGSSDAAATNTSFELARPVEVGPELGVLQAVTSDAQVDYFRFEGEAGAFYVLTTSEGRFTPNNLITLYGPNREPIAENDRGGLWLGDGIDARLVVRLRESGTHYVVADDRTTPAAYFLDPDVPVLFYRMTVAAVGAGGPGLTPERADGPTPILFAEDDASGFRYTTLLGTLAGEQGDAFEFQGADALALIGHATTPGELGNGSTSLGGVLRVLDAAQAVVAQIDAAHDQQDIHPPVSDQRYQFQVEATGEAGDNDFYAIDLLLLPDNPTEQQEGLNDEPEGAETLEMTGMFRRRGLLLSRLQPGDVDHYRFDAMAGEVLLASCESRSAGSAVLGLSAELLDQDGDPLGIARETESEALLIENLVAPTDGSYVLRLQATGLDQTIDGDWARCVVRAELR